MIDKITAYIDTYFLPQERVGFLIRVKSSQGIIATNLLQGP